MRFIAAPIFALVLTVGLASANDRKKSDPSQIGNRDVSKGVNFYSIEKEMALGKQLAEEVQRQAKVLDDPIITEYVNRLGQNLVRNSDAKVPFTFRVIDGPEVNAFALPGGYIFVYTGLIKMADEEDELAAALAHEIAHVAARHATRAMTRRDVCRIIDSVAYVAGPAGAGAADIGGLAGPLSVKKFSRDAEYEADLLAIEYAYAAGYDPQALLDALEKLHAIEEHKKSEMAKIPGYHLGTKLPFHSKIAKSFANYPLTEERIGRIQSEMAEFLPNRKDYILDTDEFQEVKAHLLASQAPVLRHHANDEGDNNAPVLRRHPDSDDVIAPSNVAPLSQRSVSVSFVDGR